MKKINEMLWIRALKIKGVMECIMFRFISLSYLTCSDRIFKCCALVRMAHVIQYLNVYLNVYGGIDARYFPLT